MNSVKLANRILTEIKQFSMLPSEDHLYDLVNKTPYRSYIKFNAYRRLLGFLRPYKSAFDDMRRDPGNQEKLQHIGKLATTRIEEGPVNITIDLSFEDGEEE